MHQPQDYPPIRNVIGVELNPYAEAARLCDALWPYRDYPEVKAEWSELRKRRDSMRLPKGS